MALSEEFKAQLRQQAAESRVSNTPVVSEQANIQPVETQPLISGEKSNITKPTSITKDISTAEEIKKFGGPIGSQEYLNYQAERSVASRLPRELGGAFGINLPGQSQWDDLSTIDKSATLAKASAFAGGRMLKNLPKDITRAVAGVGLMVIKPLYNIVTRKPFSASALAKEEIVSVPWLGEIPTMYQTAKTAEQSGMGPVMSKVFAGSAFFLEVAAMLPVSEIFVNSFRPRGNTSKPGGIKNTAPIKTAIVNNETSIKRASQAEYYSLRKKDAKQFGGNSSDTYWKIAPSTEGIASLSVTKQVPKSKIGDYAKTEFGLKKVQQGDFGPEVNLYDVEVKVPAKAREKITPVPKDIQEASGNIFAEFDIATAGERISVPAEIGGGSQIVGIPSTFPKWVPEELRSKKLFKSVEDKLSSRENKLRVREQRLVDEMTNEVAKRTGRDPATISKENLVSEFETRKFTETKRVQQGKDTPIFVLPKERKGASNRPVTEKQLNTLYDVSDRVGMNPEMRDAVVRTITGKENLGDLTEKEFVRATSNLASFGEKYSTPGPALGPAGRLRAYVSPPRHYFDYVEDTFGIPLKSQVYTPMERAAQMTKVLDDKLQPELQDLFGKYSKQKFSEERRLIDAYTRGDKTIITENKTLSSVEKAEMIKISDDLIKWDDKYGEVLGVGREAYVNNYGGPKISDLGGVVPMYKDLDSLAGKEFFAKFKRVGSLDPYIDDALASRQIYIKEGSKALHFKPALENFNKLYKELPNEYKRQANSYVQEKLGRLGATEKLIDSFVPTLNKKLRINLPQDASRQLINYSLSSMYSGLVGTPKAVFQQIFQLPLFVYSKIGTEFAGEALVKSFSRAERDRVAKGGWLNDISLPYGAELSKDFNPASKAGQLFKTGTQTTLKPITVVDNDVRIKTFLQAEMQWNKQLNSFNEGKTQWNQFESNMDFGSFSKADRNLIRQRLIGGDQEGAFNIFMRETLDETSFPYRRGSGARITYGLTGKLGTGLLNYSIESTNVLGRWTANKQWDKVIRFAGNAGILNGTMEETFNLNFGDVVFQKPYGIVSPVFKMMSGFYDVVQASIENNRVGMNDAWKEISNQLKVSTPVGILRKNIRTFKKALDIGPDAQGNFPIYNEKGQIIREGDFTDLFWGTLVGFPTVEKINERSAYTRMRNDNEVESQIKDQLNTLLREGNYDEMEKIINKTGIFPSKSAMNSVYIPRLQRLFQNSSTQIKAKNVENVFPQK